MSSSYDLDLAKAKKKATDRLQTKLVKAGYAKCDVDKLSRDELINEYMAYKGHGTSKLVKITVIPSVQSEVAMFMQMFMQQQADYRREQAEQRRIDQERFITILNQQKIESDANIKVLADSIKSSNEQAHKDKESEIAKQEARDKTKEVQLKRYGDLLKNIITYQPQDDFDLPVYLTSVETVFELQNVPKDLRATLLMPYLNSKAKTLICRLSPEQISTYDSLKAALLREFRLTPKQYRLQFSRARPKEGESFVQFTTRLSTIWRYYVESRNVKDYESLFNLSIADKLKDTLSYNVYAYVVSKEGDETFNPTKLAQLADVYVNEVNVDKPHKYNYSQVSYDNRDYRPKNNNKRYGFEAAIENKNASNAHARQQKEKKNVKCFNCGEFGHVQKFCKKPKIAANGIRTQNVSVENVVNTKLPSQLDTQTFTDITQAKTNRVSVDCDNNSITANYRECNNYQNNDWSEWLYGNDNSVLNELYVDKVKCVSQSQEIKLSIPELVTVCMCNTDIVCTIDSGAEMTVVRRSKLPEPWLRANAQNDCKIVILKSAFNNNVEAKVANVPCCLGKCYNKNAKTTVNLVCALTDELSDGIDCLLTKDDYDQLLDDARIRNSAILAVVNDINVKDDVNSIEQQTDTIENSQDISLEPKSDVNEIRKQQIEDCSLNQCFEQAKLHKNNFYIRSYDNLLFHKDEVQGVSVHQLVLPNNDKRNKVLTMAHCSLWGGHLSAKKTSQRIRLSFWWPSMLKDIKQLCMTCKDCQMHARKTVYDRTPITAVVRPSNTFEVVNCDLIGPFEQKSAGGHMYVLVLVDQCSRWVEAIPLRNCSAKSTCDALLEIFARTGIPKVIISDNGTNFTSSLMTEFRARLGCSPRFSAPYHPEGNSLVERHNAVIKNMLHHVIRQDARNWHRQLPILLWAMREVPNQTTGMSPFTMVYGKLARGPLSILKETWTGELSVPADFGKTATAYMQDLKERLEIANKLATEIATKEQKNYVERYNLRARDKSFNVGDLVIVLMPDSTNKLYSRWIGPVTVKERVNGDSNTYIISMQDGTERKLHANKLRLFHAKVASVGVIFESDETFGEIKCTPSSTDNNDKLNFNLTQLSHEERCKMLTMLNRHKQVFSDKPGLCKIGVHEIKLKPGYVPKRKVAYRIPEKLRAEVDRQINDLLDQGLIIPSNSPYASPIVCVMKKDGSVRLTCDYREINAGTVDDAFPMQNAQDLLLKVGRCKWITCLDCSQGFYQIAMHTDSIDKTAFISHAGLFSWTRMSFGLKNACSTYQRVMNVLLEKHKQYAAAYIDDIIVFDDTFEDHVNHVHAVLSEFENNNVTLKLKKCDFARPEVLFLGHIVGSGMHRPYHDKVTAILNIKAPTSKKQLKQFLGMIGYYRLYIMNFAEIALPLTDMTKNNQPQQLQWNATHQCAFDKLKSIICNSPVLRTPNWNKPFIIRADASNFAAGVCLAQDFDCNNSVEEHPIAYASCKFTDSQKMWSTIEKECYAILYGFKVFDFYVFGSKIVVYSDHNPLKYLTINAPKNARLTRWVLAMQRYDFELKHIKGKDNKVCDALSRLDIVDI